MGGDARLFRAEVIAVLHPVPLWLQHGTDLVREGFGFFWREIQERQAGENDADMTDRLVMLAQQIVQMPGIAGDDVRTGKTFAEQLRHVGIVLDGDELFLAQAALQQRLGDGAGAGAEFEDKAFRVTRQPAGHGGGELAGAGCDRSHALWMGQPLAQEQRRIRQCRNEFFGHDAAMSVGSGSLAGESNLGTWSPQTLVCNETVKYVSGCSCWIFPVRRPRPVVYGLCLDGLSRHPSFVP